MHSAKEMTELLHAGFMRMVSMKSGRLNMDGEAVREERKAEIHE